MDTLRMTLQGRYTLRDFTQAWNLYLGIGLFSRILGVLVLLIFGAAGLDCLLEQPRDYVPGVLSLAFPVIVLWFIFWRIPHRWRSPFLRRDDGVGCEIHVTPTGVRFMTQNNQHDWNWGAFVSWSEYEGCFILITEDMGFEFVPKHLFPDSVSMGAFRVVLKQHIVRRTIRLVSQKEAEKMNRPVLEDETVPLETLYRGVRALMKLFRA